MPATSIRAAITGLGLLLLLGSSAARADDTVCPAPAVATGALPPAARSKNTGDETITLDGDQVEYSVNGDAILSGNVEMHQGDKRVRADHLEYDAKDQRLKLEGGVEYKDPALTVRGDSGTYSAVLGAEFEGAQFDLPERNAHGAAGRMAVGADGKVTLNDVAFSTCPVTDLAWQMKAKQIQLDTRARNGTSRGARVEFKGVPIFYSPWLTFPIGPQRKSGFMFPNFGISSRSGAQFDLPYYFNIRPNLDFTAQPVYYQKRGVDFAGELRYMTARQRGTINFNYLPKDDDYRPEPDLKPKTRSRVVLNHVAELPGEWRFRIDATHVSDVDYFEDFALGPEGTSVPFTEQLAELTYRDEHLNVRAQFQHFDTIDDELLAEQRPYARTPRILASGDWDAGSGFSAIDYGFDGELVNFDRNVGVTGWRMDVAPHVGLDWSGAGYFVRPTAGYRYTQYALRDTAPGTDDSPTRSLPFASLDAGMVFERSSGSHGQRRVTLEPRALYLYTPFRDQSDLPLFDTGLPDLNLVQLYRTNRYVGADRVNDANQIAFGFTTRLLNAHSGEQYLAASVGQAYYFEKPRVVLPDEPPATRDSSDFIAQVSLSAYKNWNLEAGIQWNPEDSLSERSQFRLQYRPGGDRVVNLGYRAQRDRVEQSEFSAAWPISKRWNAFGRVVYSMRDNETLDKFAGLEFKGCCFRLRAVARRFISNRNGDLETSYYVQLELNGLASVGTSADAFLERTIRGYSPETPVR